MRTTSLMLSEITPDPTQPRKLFREDKLRELAASIEEHGLLEPIVVTRYGQAWIIVAGERRWRACRMTTRYQRRPVPVRTISVTKRQKAELALIENIQREDLSPMEEARAFQDLIDNHGSTPQEIAHRLGYKHALRVNWRLQLLRLLPEYQDLLDKGHLTLAQARIMSGLSHESQRKLFRLIGDGKAGTEDKLKRLAAALGAQEQQPSFFAPPDPKHQAVRAKYDRLLDSVLGLLNRSFDAEDLSVLKAALQGNVALNIERIDLIVKHLHRIKRAMVEAHSVQQVLGEEKAA